MAKYLLDSNIIIDYARGYAPTIDFLYAHFHGRHEEVYLSVVTEAELYAGESFAKLDAFLTEVFPAEVIPVDSRIARRAGTLKRTNASLDLVDALIAATALTHDCQLITRNAHHFHGIPDLAVLSPESKR